MAPSTKKSYDAAEFKFVSWLVETESPIADPDLAIIYRANFEDRNNAHRAAMQALERLRADLDDEHPSVVEEQTRLQDIEKELDKDKKAIITDWITNSPTTPPFLLERFRADDLTTFIEFQRRFSRGVGITTYSTYRSAINSVFARYKTPFPVHINEALRHYFTGLKKEAANALMEGVGRVQVGKEQLPYSLYSKLCEHWLKSLEPDAQFSHLFAVLSWNLIARAKNVVTLKTAHMHWDADAMKIYLPVTKTDQRAERPRDAKHVYANPLQPAVCPILAMAIYLFTFPASGTLPLKLFPGGKQYDRFSKSLARALSGPLADDMAHYGLEQDHVGTHSFRKGASSYVAGGSVSGPSIIPLQLRAGWSVGGVQDRYLRFEAAGDQFVGRTVCGLPIGEATFSVLPPRLMRSAEVDEMLLMSFPKATRLFQPIYYFCLSSLVHHSAFLLNNLPHHHPLFNTNLFRNTPRLDRLRSLLVTPDNDQTGLVPTGIPAHVVILSRLLENDRRQAEYVGAVEKTVRATMMEMAEQYFGGLNTPKPPGEVSGSQDVREELNIFLGEVRQILHSVQNPLPEQPDPDPVEDGTTADQRVTVQGYVWGGGFHILPENYKFPSMSVALAYRFWWHGNEAKGIPPIRQVDSKEMTNRSGAKRLSEFSALMKLYDDCARQAGAYMDSPSEQDVLKMFEAASPLVGMLQPFFIDI